MAEPNREKQRVFVMGGGTVTPQGLTWPETREATLAGVIAIKQIPDEFAPHIHYKSAEVMPPGARETSVRHGGFVDGFDPKLHLPGKTSRRRERCAQMMAAAGGEAIRQAGVEPLPRLSDKEDTPDNPINLEATQRVVTIGMGLGDGINVIDYHMRLINGQVIDSTAPLKIEPEQAATTLNQLWNFQGPGKAVVAACAGGGAAMTDIARKIANREAKMGLAGAVDSFVYKLASYGVYQAATALATFGDNEDMSAYFASMAYDKRRRGFVHAEGAAAIFLEGEDSVRERGAEGKILAEVVGWGETNDASEIGRDTEPKVRGQVMSMNLAAKMASISPEEITYVNGHGTGTPLGDPVEMTSILTFRKNNVNGLYVSGTKSMVGHGISWTAVKEALETVWAVKSGFVPPTPNHDQMMEIPKDLLERWNLTTAYRDVDLVPQTFREHKPLYGASNSFGFGGNNNTIIFKAFDGF